MCHTATLSPIYTMIIAQEVHHVTPWSSYHFMDNLCVYFSSEEIKKHYNEEKESLTHHRVAHYTGLYFLTKT